MPNFFDRYILQVEEDADLLPTLAQTADFTSLVPADALAALGDRVYAPGKWTVRDTLQHLIDTERIMAYRALAFSRGEQQSLPGFEEDEYVKNSNAGGRTMLSLIEEYTSLRHANIVFYKSLSEEMYDRKGIANGREISVRALIAVTLGHELHHLSILKERYW